MIVWEETRIYKLRDYLFKVINKIKDEIKEDKEYQINADMLSGEVNNYSLDKIPTVSQVEKWITGTEIHKDVYSLRSRCEYSQDAINNLQNIGFFEVFESLILSNNKNKILPEIEGIQSIQCLNCGALDNADTNTAEFDIQIQITYKI